MITRLLQQIIASGLGFFGLLVLILLALMTEIGFQIGRLQGRAARLHEKDASGVSTLTSGILGLVAFTLAVTIGIAQSRFEARRQAILNEANAIGSAWLRMGSAGPPGKPIAGLIEQYAHVRLAYLEAAKPKAVAAALVETNALQTDIWRRASPVLAAMPSSLAAGLASSLNDMFGASLVERYSRESGAPLETMVGLLLGAMGAAGALGYQMGLAGRRQLVLSLLLFLMMSGAMAMIIDFNRPQGGFIHTDPAPLIWTIEGFSPNAAS